MENPLSRLKECRTIIFKALNDDITEITIDSSVYQLKVVFSIGSILSIRFNEFDEYGYQLLYSKKKGDFIRFDNFDDKWEVKSKPNHYHTRYNGKVVESPMRGIPNKDQQGVISLVEAATKVDVAIWEMMEHVERKNIRAPTEKPEEIIKELRTNL